MSETLKPRLFAALGDSDYKLARLSHGAEPWHYWCRESIEAAIASILPETPTPEMIEIMGLAGNTAAMGLPDDMTMTDAKGVIVRAIYAALRRHLEEDKP